MPPYLTPLQIFENYKKTNPQKCKGKSTTEICRLAGLSDKQIAELKTTSAWLFCFDKENSSINQDFSMTEILGGHFKYTKTSNKKQNPLPYKFQNKKDDDGNCIVDLTQFEPSNLKKIFNEELFDIKKENDNTTVIDKKTKKVVFKAEKITDDFGNFYYNIHQDFNGKKTVTKIDNGYYETEIAYNKDGSHTVSDFQFGKDFPQKKIFYDKTNAEKWFLLYDVKGREYQKEYANGKVENYLVNELIQDITAKTRFGLPTTRNSLKQHLEQIQWNNAAEVLYTYYETTGRDLIADINEEIGLSKQLREQLCEQIIEKLQQDAGGLYNNKFSNYMIKVLNKDMSSLSSTNFDYHIAMASKIPNLDKFVESYNKTYESKDFLKEINKHSFLKNSKGKELFDKAFTTSHDYLHSAKYLADLLDDDISGIGSGKLEQHIKFITPYNVEQVMKYYTRPKVLGVNVENFLKKFNVTEDEYKYVSTLEPLITAIYAEWGIPEKKRYELMNYVFEQLKQYDRNKPTYYDDIIEDLSNNMNDSIKRKVDLKRLDNRLLSGQDRDFVWTDKISQGSTGDCWLLAGIISILNKNNGTEMIDKIVLPNPKENGYIVNLKGVNKKVKVSYSEIENMNHLSNGNYQVTAIEIAVDKYMKENAYADNSIFSNPDFDINGNTASFLYNLVLCNGKICSPNDISDINEFNNHKKVYSIGFRKIIGDKNHKYPGLGIDENGNKVDIVRNHEYAIKGSDKEYVYLINPWDSTVTIKVKWEDIKNLPFPKPDISYAEVE